VETTEQAWQRAGVGRDNKGRDAMLACLHMIALRKEMKV
jgi:6,7-dimethyl-8-ribityllumazine synthase